MSPSSAQSGPSEAAGLTLRLFGPMTVRVGPHPLPPLRSRKGLWLLALLILRGGRHVERRWLAGTLWPDCDEAHALRSLRQSLHDLRRALGAEAWRLAHDAPLALRLDLTGAEVDVLRFDDALAREDVAEAVDCYAGPLIEDCAEEWCLEERRSRELSYLSALSSLAERAAAAGDDARAVALLERATAVDPFREDLQQALMRALTRAGSPAKALRVYAGFRDLTLREMAAEPSEETTELFRRLREETRARTDVVSPRRAVAVPTSRLPRPLTPLIGREEEVRELTERLTAARLLTLTGTGGVGKTRLALQVARELESRCEAGAAFVPLAHAASADHVTAALRSTLKLGPGETVEELRARAAAGRMLLVLDNCEQVSAPCAELTVEVLGACPTLLVLATSREHLGVPGETVWRVPSLALPAQDDAPEASAAVELFLDRARAAFPDLELTPDGAAAAAGICRRLDGIPLAIELAAARAGALTFEEIERRLQADFRLLDRAAPGLPTRHQTLRATFDWSWDLLDPPERLLLGRLSVFAGGATLEAIEQVCAAAPLSPAEAVDGLLALVDRSLVHYSPAEGGEPARYGLLETIRRHAAERLGASDEGASVATAHCAYFLRWAEEIKPRLWGPEQARWFERLEREQSNLRAALDHCRSVGDVEQELRLVVALSRFWDTHGHLQEGRDHLRAALDRPVEGIPEELRVRVHVHAGWMAYAQGDHSEARRHYRGALDLLRAGDDRRLLADTLNCLALVTLDDGNLEEARALFEEALVLCLQLDGSTRLGSVLGNLGALALRQGDLRGARDYLERSATWCERAGDTQLHGLALHDLSLAACEEGRWSEAGERCAGSLRLLHDSGAVVNIPMALEQMARVAQAGAHAETAARLRGAADGLRVLLGLSPVRDEVPHNHRRAYDQGRAMKLDEAVRFALEVERPASRRAGSP